jgi:hypothetical protein
MPKSQNSAKPRSEAQKEAARRNGTKSRGPVTAMGKAISSRNALRHGLEASDIALTSENPEAFSEVLSEYMDEYRPIGPTETTLVEHLAIAHFRLYRAWTTETALYNIEMAENDERLTKKYTHMAHPVRTADATETMLARSNALPHIHRCQARVSREYYRALNQILALRKPPQAQMARPCLPPPTQEPKTPIPFSTSESQSASHAESLIAEIAESNPAISLETQEPAMIEPGQLDETVPTPAVDRPGSQQLQSAPRLPLVAAILLALGTVIWSAPKIPVEASQAQRDRLCESPRTQGHLTPIPFCAYYSEAQRDRLRGSPRTQGHSTPIQFCAHYSEAQRDRLCESPRTQGHSTPIPFCAYYSEAQRDRLCESPRTQGHSTPIPFCAYYSEAQRDRLCESPRTQGHSTPIPFCAYYSEAQRDRLCGSPRTQGLLTPIPSSTNESQPPRKTVTQPIEISETNPAISLQTQQIRMMEPGRPKPQTPSAKARASHRQQAGPPLCRQVHKGLDLRARRRSHGATTLEIAETNPAISLKTEELQRIEPGKLDQLPLTTRRPQTPSTKGPASHRQQAGPPLCRQVHKGLDLRARRRSHGATTLEIAETNPAISLKTQQIGLIEPGQPEPKSRLPLTARRRQTPSAKGPASHRQQAGPHPSRQVHAGLDLRARRRSHGATTLEIVETNPAISLKTQEIERMEPNQPGGPVPPQDHQQPADHPQQSISPSFRQHATPNLNRRQKTDLQGQTRRRSHGDQVL